MINFSVKFFGTISLNFKENSYQQEVYCCLHSAGDFYALDRHDWLVGAPASGRHVTKESAPQLAYVELWPVGVDWPAAA